MYNTSFILYLGCTTLLYISFILVQFSSNYFVAIGIQMMKTRMRTDLNHQPLQHQHHLLQLQLSVDSEMKIEGEAELQGKAEGEREGEEEGEEEKEEEGEKEGEEEGQAEGETEEEGDNHDLLFLLASQKDGTPQMNRTFCHL